MNANGISADNLMQVAQHLEGDFYPLRCGHRPIPCALNEMHPQSGLSQCQRILHIDPNQQKSHIPENVPIAFSSKCPIGFSAREEFSACIGTWSIKRPKSSTAQNFSRSIQQSSAN
jgi:hypothetical protein